MMFVYRAAIIALATFASALIGFGVQSLLPDSYVAASKGMIGSVSGLDATLLALVLGLLIWTAHGQFTAQLAQLQVIGRALILLDLAFAGYGPEAAQGRRELRGLLARVRQRLWIDDPKGRRILVDSALVDEVLPMRGVLFSLRPADDDQRQHLAAARERFGTIVDTELTMVRSLVNPVPNSASDNCRRMGVPAVLLLRNDRGGQSSHHNHGGARRALGCERGVSHSRIERPLCRPVPNAEGRVRRADAGADAGGPRQERARRNARMSLGADPHRRSAARTVLPPFAGVTAWGVRPPSARVRGARRRRAPAG